MKTSAPSRENHEDFLLPCHAIPLPMQIMLSSPDACLPMSSQQGEFLLEYGLELTVATEAFRSLMYRCPVHHWGQPAVGLLRGKLEAVTVHRGTDRAKRAVKR